MSFTRTAQGEIRAVWVVLTFTVVAVLGVSLADFVLAVVQLHFVTSLADVTLPVTALPMLVGALPATVFCRWLFKTPVGLVDSKWKRHLCVGFALGVVALSLATVVPAVAGVTTLRWNGLYPTAAARQFLAFAIIAAGEELMMRGLVFQLLWRRVHALAAVVLTGGIFGALHLTNPSSSFTAAAIIALVGFWFGAVTARTGSLWCAFGLHLSWNFCEGWVFGQPVSGLQPSLSLLLGGPSSAGFWSGGQFGPEAAGWTAVLLAVGTGLTMLWPMRDVAK